MPTLTSRRPTVRFPRLHGVEVAQKCRIHWNGARAVNGDGKPNAGGTPVDYATILAGPLEIWPAGKISFFGGQFLRCGFLAGGTVVVAGNGFLGGPFLIGEFLRPGGYFAWSFPFDLRDGDYTVGVVGLDRVGNVSGALGEYGFTIAAVPRPASSVKIDSYVVGTNTLNVSWTHSPDFLTT